ncbi:trk system potassium uptake protein TrkH [Clostridium cavendishii DSM 21758]|uniref:Trk system potassium uptake protein TrkH n=1 Tax=Clostridium cavendishii DSM 21758 TaxID=1121302 RepID=A0A1M6KUC5_9CLOT|nr:TrkH family potassium uptake protein [Clostridium cavendishii]SHJ62565.1 trk system potassium uptake protein TrkH [Clostridium cavendishii DSM 21758]
MYININKRIKLNPLQILALGFLIVILAGATILTLPISSANGSTTNFLDSLFTATSATCVTGLVTVDTGTHWSYFGKTVIIILIQVGGLGFMSFATLFALLIGKKITLKDRLLLQEAMNTFEIQGLVRLMKYILAFTFTVEGVGALIYSTKFIPQFGWGKGIYYSIWHAVSFFCNAGFDLMGHFNSLTGYSDNKIVILNTAMLIVIGGLGFAVSSEVYNYRKSKRKFSLHSKVVLTVTSILVFGGAFVIFLLEYNNPGTMKNMTFMDKICNSILAAVTPRTAGVNSVSTSDMAMASRVLTIILMFIGGSPGSTAGGIKTTTFGVLFLTLKSMIKGSEDVEVYGKRISKDIVYKSFALFMLCFMLVITVSGILSITEIGASFEYILYEVVSAFGTVGLTLGLTTKLTAVGKFFIILTMYCGRVGPLTVILALANINKKSSIRYPEEKILIG